ncbi:MAG: hypothetical protein A2842_02765 [Candidatus Wildermuthbacteria bacterium RIFCSPHIGHO2_01_FULL_48_25]|uniref:Peptidase M20 dimerisation domain-containing protein n=1 Tax=Candidatus Wildermuthbacteria bacterium RIFCSPLOWO2_01_FULL_48_16 TaxID=1802461 RepID=A0A1G2RJK9_9BACT|nr:MAG: hypothetical protein A2842_02765 [Candidatus Wildermuthbacteria bacterium RIFCSPHIGHO2_01_FULL_48_25]OHA68176.1 MAG: hypothetical protein A3J57_02130 [Candidatus Wildermuthbacteria bacterium RIFCSPHIGHO2_02_FULL_49_12b]OHA73023.1 MAG: hypothetical protein A3B24_01250 [Candidatus Wildermuthbacteria bacterium RIFCSPLOWO2_01_FULL_48_16]
MKLEQILKTLIRFKTVTSDQKQNALCLRWIQKQCKKYKVFTKLIYQASFPSLLITTQKTKTPTLWLGAHVDVVPGSPQVFVPKQKESRLYGRGTFDMKFAVACYLKLLEDLSKKLPRYDFGIMLTSDEEIGGEEGVKYLVAKGYRSKVVFIPDGGQNWDIEKGAKGVLELEVVSKGISAHGSRTWLGGNAITSLMGFLDRIQKLFPQEPCGDTIHWHATCNVGVIEGGKAANQIPDFAKAQLSIRIPSESQTKALLKKIRALEKKFPSIKVAIVHATPSFRNDFKLSFAELFSRIAKNKYGIKTGLDLSHGTSDARFFVQRGIPAVSVRPQGGGHHGENEWIDLKDLERFYSVFKDFVIQVSQKT